MMCMEVGGRKSGHKREVTGGVTRKGTPGLGSSCCDSISVNVSLNNQAVQFSKTGVLLCYYAAWGTGNTLLLLLWGLEAATLLARKCATLL